MPTENFHICIKIWKLQLITLLLRITGSYLYPRFYYISQADAALWGTEVSLLSLGEYSLFSGDTHHHLSFCIFYHPPLPSYPNLIFLLLVLLFIFPTFIPSLYHHFLLLPFLYYNEYTVLKVNMVLLMFITVPFTEKTWIT